MAIRCDNTEAEEMEISDEEMEMEMDESESDFDESRYDESEDEYPYEDEEYVASLQASLDNIGDIDVLSEDMSMTRILDIIRARQLRGTMELELMVRKRMEITAEKLDEIQSRGYVPCSYVDFIRNEYPVIRSSLPPYKPKKRNYLYKEIDRIRRRSDSGRGSVVRSESATSTPYSNNFENDPPIYLQVLVDEYYAWHVIKPGNFTPQDAFLGNILPTQPRIGDNTESVTFSVGSRIYLIGHRHPSIPGLRSTKSLKDFYYIDTTSRGQGGKWNKGLSLPKPIAFPFAVVLNNNNNGGADNGNQVKENLSSDKNIENRGDLLLVGGSYGPLFDPKNNSVQAYVLEEGGSVWRSLNTVIPPKLTGRVTGHVVHRLGGTKHMLVYSSDSPDLYEYDFHSGNWGLVCKDFGCFQKASALVGSILYTMDSQNPGYIFALDTSSSQSLKKRIPVELDYPEDKHWWVPQQDKYRDSPASFFMVPLGNHKLAIIWYYRPKPLYVKGKSRNVLVIWCTRWEVSKADSTNGLFKLKAYSRARYFSDATGLVNCLPT